MPQAANIGVGANGRRTVLRALVLVPVGLVAGSGCTGSQPPPPASVGSPSPSAAGPSRPASSAADAVAARIVGEKRGLLDRYRTTAAGYPRLAARLEPLAADHRAHLAALTSSGASSGDGTPPAAGGTASPSAVPVPALPTPTLPPTPDAALEALARSERALAERRLADVLALPGPTARLVASIGAAEAVHAGALSGSSGDFPGSNAPASSAPQGRDELPPPGSSASELEALQSGLAAEHAVVYGYGVVGAHLDGDERAAATRRYFQHLSRRDVLEDLVSARGGQPRAAEPAYETPFEVTNPRTARRLAVILEEGAAQVHADLVGASTGTVRVLAARLLQAAALGASQWRGGGVAFPGLPERS